ncbi:MAG: hypothetical protein HC938_06990 [Nitrospira sp.]|nr:hypothetical protein [Nitrospira sp.]
MLDVSGILVNYDSGILLLQERLIENRPVIKVAGFPPLIDFSTIDRVRLAELVMDTSQGEKHDGHRSK